MGRLRDVDAARPRVLWALIVTLSFSRYQFVWPTFDQTETVCDGLDGAWMFFGGMTKTIVPDNMKALIERAARSIPSSSLRSSTYVQARGTEPIAIATPWSNPTGVRQRAGWARTQAARKAVGDEAWRPRLPVRRRACGAPLRFPRRPLRRRRSGGPAPP